MSARLKPSNESWRRGGKSRLCIKHTLRWPACGGTGYKFSRQSHPFITNTAHSCTRLSVNTVATGFQSDPLPWVCIATVSKNGTVSRNREDCMIAWPHDDVSDMWLPVGSLKKWVLEHPSLTKRVRRFRVVHKRSVLPLHRLAAAFVGYGRPGSTSRGQPPPGRPALLIVLQEPTVTILRYGLPVVHYARTLANPDGTAMIINKRRFCSTL
jgi:hypothetical protein